MKTPGLQSKHNPKPFKRRHIPALTPNRLQMALEQIDGAKLSKHTRETLKGMVKAAANPQAETPEAVLRSLPPERQQDILALQRELRTQVQGFVQRAHEGLLGMSEAAWQALVEEAE